MIIVGDNLKELMKQHSIVEDVASAFDETSISLRLDNAIIEIVPPENSIFSFGDTLPVEWIKETIVANNEFIELKPLDTLLACSYEVVNIPIGYFGFIQTKGSLARLFVSIHCSDSQIEPGFSGKITFEMVNYSKFTIRIKPKQKVGDLFIFKTSTKQVKPYDGRYNKSIKPTIQKPEN